MFITAPTVAPEAYDRLVGSFEELIRNHEGNVINTDKWGRRTLAYEVKKFKEGIYTVVEYEAPADFIKEFERRMRLNDSVLKYLTVKTERKQKLINKGSARRQARQELKSRRRAARSKSSEERR